MQIDMQPTIFENMHSFAGFWMLAVIVGLLVMGFGAGYLIGRAR